MSGFLDRLEWRFATKKFAAGKKIADADLQKILWAIRMTPTSYGLQPFHIYVLTADEMRVEMRRHAWNQPQVTDASHVLIFCARTDMVARIDDYIELAARGNSAYRIKLQPLKLIMWQALMERAPEALADWAARQAYLACAFALAACAELGIDSCPMEGFNASACDKLLELPAHLRTVLLMPIGYRDGEPAFPKTRFPETDLFTFIDNTPPGK